MKRIIVIMLLACTCAAIAVPSQLKEMAIGLFDKLTTFVVDEVLGEELCTKIWKEVRDEALSPLDLNSRWMGENDLLSSASVYRKARKLTFEATFDEDANAIGGFVSNTDKYRYGGYWQVYHVAREVVIERIKEHLHKGDNLKTFYKGRRLIVLGDFSTMKEQEQDLLYRKVKEVLTIFKEMKNEKNQQRFVAWISHSSRKDNLVGKLPEELANIMVERITMERKMTFLRRFSDHNVAAFAGRRWAEGGDELLDKYIEVLEMVASDMGVFL
jgi:hypothetical protein